VEQDTLMSVLLQVAVLVQAAVDQQLLELLARLIKAGTVERVRLLMHLLISMQAVVAVLQVLGQMELTVLMLVQAVRV
jgi:hypothetical protein